MKLFDLLKSLNNDTAVNPDAHSKSPDSDHRLLDELHSLLAILDAPTPTLTPTTTSTPAPQAAMRISDDSVPTLNLATIFDETTEPEPPLPTHITATVTTQPQRPVVRELLDEFLPMLTQALGERLDQLDDITLQQWRQAITQHPVESEPTAE